MGFDLVGIGNPVYDSIVTPLSKTNGRILSGCSTNACLAARKLGMAKVGLVGCVGKDYLDRFQKDLDRYGISLGLSSVTQETGGFHLVYDDSGNRTLEVLGVSGKITRQTFPAEFLDSRYLLIGPILGEVDLGLIEFLRASSRAQIFLDPQGLLRAIAQDRRVVHRCDASSFGEISKKVDFIKPNEPESVTITGSADPEIALRFLSKLGDAVPIVTLAEKGSLLLNGDKVHHIPAFRTRAIDPTGAGDVYAGSFITEYARTKDLAEAAVFASAAASMMVEQVGPDFIMNREKVERRKESIRGLMATELLG